MKACKNCVHWDDKETECMNLDDANGRYDVGDRASAIYITVADDSDLEWKLLTGPDFYCSRFKSLGGF